MTAIPLAAAPPVFPRPSADSRLWPRVDDLGYRLCLGFEAAVGALFTYYLLIGGIRVYLQVEGLLSPLWRWLFVWWLYDLCAACAAALVLASLLPLRRR